MKNPVPRKSIEYPSRGTTYCRPEYGVYEYSAYPRHSVLAGQQRRVFVDSFPTLEAAQAAHPDAKKSSSQFQPPNLSHLPDGPDI